jgi:hypothetical protein
VAELEKNSWAGHSKKKRENFVLKCTLDISFSFTFNSRSSALCILEIKGNTVQVLQTQWPGSENEKQKQFIAWLKAALN